MQNAIVFNFLRTFRSNDHKKPLLSESNLQTMSHEKLLSSSQKDVIFEFWRTDPSRPATKTEIWQNQANAHGMLEVGLSNLLNHTDLFRLPVESLWDQWLQETLFAYLKILMFIIMMTKKIEQF